MLILLTKIYMAYKLLTWINQVINSIPNDNLCLILIAPDQPLTKSDWFNNRIISNQVRIIRFHKLYQIQLNC